MAHADFVLYIIKLVLGAISAFCAILLWSKTHDGAVMCLVAGVVILFAGVVYQMLLDMGFVPLIPHEFFGVPILSLFFAIVPPVLFIIGFMQMILRSKR